jgi:hypothetical protein
MPRANRSPRRDPLDEALFAVKRRKIVPFEFVLDALAPLAPATRAMFGCLAVYVEDQIVLILRDRHDWREDNGVWLATTQAHHESLQRDFPRMRSIRLFGRPVTHWQVLPADAPDFEKAALRACDLILARDPRIGKTPKRRLVSAARGRTAAKPPAASRRVKSRSRA